MQQQATLETARTVYAGPIAVSYFRNPTETLVTVNGKAVFLSGRELSYLDTAARRFEEAVPEPTLRAEYERVHGRDLRTPAKNTISLLKKKLDSANPDADASKYFENVLGRGYRLTANPAPTHRLRRPRLPNRRLK